MKLIVIEGLDGSGKSTQIKLLKEFFSKKGFNCEYLHFPRTEAPFFGELIARFLRGEFGSINKVDPYLVAMLYAGDRKDASATISTWLKKGNIVILDRYTYSNIAYQCAKMPDASKEKELKKWILTLEFEYFAVPKPDLNVFLDVPFSFTENQLSAERTGHDRNYLNGGRDIHENSLIFQRKVREMYLDIASMNEKLVVVHCSDDKGRMLPPDEISKEIIRIILDRKLI